MISVVCPFYNEEMILESSVRLMMDNLASLTDKWELIIVNDGSRDGSLEIARALEKEHPQLRVLSYPVNQGRGYAIRMGVAQAHGDIIVTTEIDSSWGDDIVHRIVAELKRRPEADIIIASPHLPGGGYKNVPISRIFFSTFGNYVIRGGLTYSITMNTGMTRGYKREKFLALPLHENDKEMHLEIVNKAMAFGYRIYEVPAVLEWKDHKLSKQLGQKRKSSSNVQRLIRTHLLFSVEVAPFRYLYPVAGLLMTAGLILVGWAFVNLFLPPPSVYLFLTGFSIALFGFLIFGIGVLAQQNRALMRELWRQETEVSKIRDSWKWERPAK